MTSKKNQFLSNIFGFVWPIGSFDDPKGYDGLMKLVSESFRYGTKSNPDSVKIFEKLERLGGSFHSSAAFEVMHLRVSAPKENIPKLRLILEEIASETLLSEENLEKLKESQISELSALMSSDRGFAVSVFEGLSMGERIDLGSEKSINSIQIKDVRKIEKYLRNNISEYYLDDSGALQLGKNFEILNPSKRSTEKSNTNYQLIKRDIEQKILIAGYSTAGLDQIDKTTTDVATALLSGGLRGIVTEEIREKNSAAYYAYYSHALVSSKGSAFMCAGVSEKNLVKSLGLMQKIFIDLSEGRFEDERLEEAKKYHLGRVERIYDSVDSIVYRSLVRAIHGLPTLTYEQEIDEVMEVNRTKIQDYFRSIVNGGDFYMVLNGKVNKKVSDKLIQLIS